MRVHSFKEWWHTKLVVIPLSMKMEMLLRCLISRGDKIDIKLFNPWHDHEMISSAEIMTWILIRCSHIKHRLFHTNCSQIEGFYSCCVDHELKTLVQRKNNSKDIAISRFDCQRRWLEYMSYYESLPQVTFFWFTWHTSTRRIDYCHAND